MTANDILAVLLSWTVKLSPYPTPAQPPQLEYREHAFFVAYACRGSKRCNVAAWYDNDGVIYLDKQLADASDPIVRSVIVHELVHYLQDMSNKFDPTSCNDHVRREREAYSVQRTYLNRIAGRVAATYPVYAPCPTTKPDG